MSFIRYPDSLIHLCLTPSRALMSQAPGYAGPDLEEQYQQFLQFTKKVCRGSEREILYMQYTKEGLLPSIGSVDWFLARSVQWIKDNVHTRQYDAFGFSVGGLLLRLIAQDLDPSLPRLRKLYTVCSPHEGVEITNNALLIRILRVVPIARQLNFQSSFFFGNAPQN